MEMLTGTQASLPKGFHTKVSGYRYQVFVERLGWELHTEGHVELDQFDRSDTVYIVAQESDDNIIGCARLLPTTRSYLLGEVFPQLLNGLPIPCSDDVWELSRFAAVDLTDQSSANKGQVVSPISVNLLKEAADYAASQGAKRLITVSPIGMERLIRRAGFHAHRAGPPMIVDGHPIFACWIEIESE